MSLTVTLMSNSPGEVATFVKPVAAELARRHPDWTREIALVPCPYATGAEAEVIRGWNIAQRVLTPGQTTRRWLKADASDRAAVCFLGGDPWHALLWKARFKVPAVAYFPEPSSWQRTGWLGGFDRVLLGYPEPGGTIIGDLRVDAVRDELAAAPLHEVEATLNGDAKAKGEVLALFPGSRWLHLKASLGPFLHVVDGLRPKRPDCNFWLSVSPFVSRERLADAADKPLRLGLSVSRGWLDGDLLRTEGGAAIKLLWGQPYRAIAGCDLALSLPGTNTAELAIAGKPTVVPLSDRVPVGGGGLLGLLDRLPGLGFLKTYLKHRKYRRLRLLALPNQRAGRVIMPEFFVRDDLSDLVEALGSLLDNRDELERIGQEARQVMGPAGAAGAFVDHLESLLDARTDHV